MTRLSGLSAFPITPADGSGRVDAGALSRLVARLVDAKVDSIGLLGSTGTYMYLDRRERRRALEAALDEVVGRVPIVVGVGALRTDEAVATAADALAAGAAAGLLSAVSYTPLTDDEVFEHFATVARESRLPIVIYDNPGTTHFRFTPALVERLSRVPGIVGIKNPTEGGEKDARHMAGQRATAPAGFSIGCSADWNCCEAMIAGADVWYSVLGGLFPKACLRIVRAAERGDAVEARRLDAALAPVWGLFRQFSSLRVVYVLADLLGICAAAPPRPILPLGGDARRQVADVLSALPEDVAG